MTGRRVALYLGIIGGLLLLILSWYAWAFSSEQRADSSAFDGGRAYTDVQTQVLLGPRIPGTPAHARALDWIKQELESAGWRVEIQQTRMMDHPIQNLRAFRADGPPDYIIGAHYDSRIFANRDPDAKKWTEPVPGANDGASGVAVLLELARTLPSDGLSVWLAFFDAEDNGDIPGWDWLLGSRAFVSSLQVRPKGMILVDMVGDEDLSIPMEANSDEALRRSIWDTAAALGHGDIFDRKVKYTIEDDHLPFIEAGIPAVDIIDIDYRYWHTTSDLPEHVSAQSLQVVGDVLQKWLAEQSR